MFTLYGDAYRHYVSLNGNKNYRTILSPLQYLSIHLSYDHAYLCLPRLPVASPRYFAVPTQRMMKHDASTHPRSLTRPA
jgi:hypothetical protein